MSECGAEGFRVRLRRLSEYGSVAYLVERLAWEAQAEQHSDNILRFFFFLARGNAPSRGWVFWWDAEGGATQERGLFLSLTNRRPKIGQKCVVLLKDRIAYYYGDG